MTEEQADEIRKYLAGKELEHLVDLPGWQVALEMLASYPNQASAALMSMAPGDPRVPNTHAAVSVLTDLYNKFIRDVANAVEAAKTTPVLVSQAFKRMSPAPVEMSA